MNTFWPYKSFSFHAGLILLLSFFYIFGRYSYLPQRSLEVSFTIIANEQVDLAIYYDLGRGVREKDHQFKTVEGNGQPVTVTFCIPGFVKLRSLRFDPASFPVNMDLIRVSLTYSDEDVYYVPLDSLIPNDQIEKVTLTDQQLSFISKPDANDPIFTFSNLGKSTPDLYFSKNIYVGLWVLSGFALYLLGRLCYLFFFRGYVCSRR